MRALITLYFLIFMLTLVYVALCIHEAIDKVDGHVVQIAQQSCIEIDWIDMLDGCE